MEDIKHGDSIMSDKICQATVGFETLLFKGGDGISYTQT